MRRTTTRHERSDCEPMTLHRIGMAKRYSEAAVYNGVVYLAGQVPEETIGQDIEAQTREVLDQIDRLLAQARSDKSHILMCQIFIADLEDFAGMNRVWDNWVTPGAPLHERPLKHV